VGTLGWNGFMIFGILYWMIPRLFGTQLYSKRLANAHFWIGTLGILLWVIPMYFSGFTQGLMWKEFDADGYLVYNNFLETTLQILPLHHVRALGGTLYLVGLIVMIYNVVKTVKQGKLVANEPDSYPALQHNLTPDGKYAWHRVLERRPVQFMVLSVVAILIGTVIEMMPTFLIESNVPTIASVQPYTPLELEGRDIYMREGCYNCHSQWVRPFRNETVRYGEYSKAGEFVYDHPFLWGSRRTGPDLHRLGGKYLDSWHYNHMYDPTLTSQGSVMPRYKWLHENKLDVALLPNKIAAMRTLGVPYEAGYERKAEEDLWQQAKAIKLRLDKELSTEGNAVQVPMDTEIIALIAYLQRLGTDIKAVPPAGQKAEIGKSLSSK